MDGWMASKTKYVPLMLVYTDLELQNQEEEVLSPI